VFKIKRPAMVAERFTASYIVRVTTAAQMSVALATGDRWIVPFTQAFRGVPRGRVVVERARM
jgi:hypothetical protein